MRPVTEGLEQEFNSLDAQRLACENYAASQASRNWVVLPEHYDDGGFTGGNMNRPGLQQLKADIEAGKIDLVLFYKIDRLSRSIADFAELLKFFDKYNVNFCTVTQDLNTATSAGRMMVNILITFAQYEREVITERVRDKMAASRLKGKWVGGGVPFGYKVVDKKLVVVPEYVEHVKRIFSRYIQVQSPKQIALELNQEGVGGIKWTNQRVSRMLTNYTYIGKVFYHGEVVNGEQERIISDAIWKKTQDFLREGPPTSDKAHRIETIAPLKGILKCGHCGGAMMPIYTKKNNRKYMYYACFRNTRYAENECPIGQLRAGMIEEFVFTQLKSAMSSAEISTAVARLTGMESGDEIRAIVSDAWKEAGNGELKRLAELLLKEVVVHEDRIEMTVNCAGFAPMTQEVWNDTEKD
jgi:site-specific DNA recombinase